MLIEPKTVPIILKLCQHNWEELSYTPMHTHPHTHTIIDIQISKLSYTVFEGQGPVEVCVEISPTTTVALPQSVTMKLAVKNITATGTNIKAICLTHALALDSDFMIWQRNTLAIFNSAAPSDYTPVSSTVYFPIGTVSGGDYSRHCIYVEVEDDEIGEYTEVFQVIADTISSTNDTSNTFNIPSHMQVYVIIKDDDGKCRESEQYFS